MAKCIVVLSAAVLLSAANGWAEQPAADTPPARPERHAEAAIELGEFWLGVDCHAAPVPLAEQLGLSDQGGLLIERVAPDSPAERAGLKRHDVIVRAGERAVAHIPELIAAVNEAGNKELKLEIIRGGQRQEVTATPARRPLDDRPPLWRQPPRGEDWDRIWQWFGRMGLDEPWRRPFRLHFFHPGAILPPGADFYPPLPNDMKVTIRKEGEEPTKITVERGDETWELTAGELEQLPDDVRPHVDRMLGRWPAGEGVRVLPRRPDRPAEAEPPGAPRGEPPSDAEQFRQQLDRQLDDMNRRLEEMRRSLDRWRGGGVPRCCGGAGDAAGLWYLIASATLPAECLKRRRAQ